MEEMEKVILVTGSNKGIGYETVRQLAFMGQHVFISGRDEKSLRAAHKSFREMGLEIGALMMDVSDPESIAKAAEAFGESGLELDVLINNAAILNKDDSSLLKNAQEMNEAVIRTNCWGPLNVIRAFLPYMSRPGRIINISSSGGSMSDPVGGWSPAYCTSKSMLNALTRQLAHELEGEGISVNAVDPGWVRTSMGGESAPRNVEQGAACQVWLAMEAGDELTGHFFRDRKIIPW